MSLTSEERKEKVAEMRKYHEATFNALGIPGAYFVCKHPHRPEGMDDKHIGFYESELSKGDNIYLEMVNMNYTPADASRQLYKFEHNPNYAADYKVKKEQFLVPVLELKVVPHQNLECKIPVEGQVFQNMFSCEEEVTSTFVTKKYKDTGGGMHKITYKNGNPNEYVYIPGDAGNGIRIYKSSLNAIIHFFKQLK